MVNFQQYAVFLWAVVAIIWILTAFGNKTTIKRDYSAGRFIYLLILAIAVGIIYFHVLPLSFLDKEIIPNEIVRGWTGLLITFFSLSFTVWARINLGKNWSGHVTLKEGHELITTGAYSLTRNPIYTGILFAFLGDAIRLGVWRGFIGVLLLLIALLIKIRREELLLSAHFGDEYANYRKRVKAIIPLLW